MCVSFLPFLAISLAGSCRTYQMNEILVMSTVWACVCFDLTFPREMIWLTYNGFLVVRCLSRCCLAVGMWIDIQLQCDPHTHKANTYTHILFAHMFCLTRHLTFRLDWICGKGVSEWVDVYPMYGAGIENQGKTENSTIFGYTHLSHFIRILVQTKIECWACTRERVKKAGDMCRKSERGREKYQTKR